jgi:hypothetical protein
MAQQPAPSSPVAQPDDPIDLETSVAGEEDPGASIDLANAAAAAGRSDRSPQQPAGAQPPMSPGDDAPAGTPGTGENVCPRCGGSGRLGASACPVCEGSGKVNAAIGGA